MHLSENDLCSTVSIGDVLDIVGQANYCSGIGINDAKLLGDIQVPKNVLCVLCVSCERGGPLKIHMTMYIIKCTYAPSSSMEYYCLLQPVVRTLNGI